tara:strand:- start:39 stop:1154 length:1116 start_codon:yes stop_codon:yes gene_type:complete
MNFEFSEEQQLLREQAQSFLADNCSTKRVRETFESESPYDRDLWQKVVDLGWTAASIPEKYQGLELSYLNLCVIAEELGRSLAPIPFSSSVYLATESLILFGTEEQKSYFLPRLASGEVIGCFASDEAQRASSLGGPKTTFSDGRISGEKIPVADGSIADFAIVLAKKGDLDSSAFIVDLNSPEVERIPVKSIDPSRDQAKLVFHEVPAEELGNKVSGNMILKAIYDRAAILFAWEQVGGSETALHMAKDYAMDRFAFGRPIASFQAIKHKLANMYVKNTLARSNCYYGAWAISTNSKEIATAAAAARLSSIQAFYFSSKENIQTHGGMGFTWEFDCQIPYRRARLLASNIGSEAIWQDKLISSIEETRAA